MSITLELLIIAILCINCFVAGTQWNEFDWEEPIAWGYMAVALVVGFVAIALILIVEFWLWLRDGLLVRGWALLWFTKHFDNMETDKLDAFAAICSNHFNTSSLHDRMYRTQVRAVFRRNGYTPRPTNTEDNG